MHRRDWLRFAAAALVGTSAPEIALTFDDPTTDDTANLPWSTVNQRILGTLAAHKIKSVLFVCGKRVDSEAGRALVAEWDRAGHLIADHSYSHLDFNSNRVTLADFDADVKKNEPLVTGYRNFTRLFRFPFFHEGTTVERRDGMRASLAQRGYRIGRATVDASDWAIDARLPKRIATNPQADLTPYRDFFLEHIWSRAQFYQSLAQRVLPHPIRHTVLLHHKALNALFLGDLISMFRQKGWKLIDADHAYRDPVYDRQPKIVPAGESLIWALAKESGKFEKELRYPGEDDVYENPRMDALHL